MNAKRTIMAAMVAVLVFGLLANFSPAAQDKSKGKANIPSQVRTALQEGMATRQGRRDIPFTIIKNFVFPAAQNLHAVILFKAKNSDLGYGPASSAPPQAKLNVYLQFYQIVSGTPTNVVQELNIPAVLQADGAAYNPDSEDWYSIGYPLPAGNYLLAMALASSDNKKVGVSYYEFSLPDSNAMQNALVTSPIFLVKKMDQMQAPEAGTLVHRGYFTYSVLQIYPNVEAVVAPGEAIEILYYVFGAKANDQQQNDIESTYEVKQADKSIIKWAVQKYDFALVSQPLPLKQTLQITSDQGTKQEVRDLQAGKYTLAISIKDKIGGSAVDKAIEFEVK